MLRELPWHHDVGLQRSARVWCGQRAREAALTRSAPVGFGGMADGTREGACAARVRRCAVMCRAARRAAALCLSACVVFPKR
jgi:hypothetical protein